MKFVGSYAFRGLSPYAKGMPVIPKMYSGADPEFIEGDVFQIIIPLPDVATATVGPTESHATTVTTTDTTTDTTTVTTTDTTTVTTTDKDIKIKKLIDFCSVARSRSEMMRYVGLSNANYFRKNFLNPLLEARVLAGTIRDKPNSRNQKYIRA